MFFGNGINPKVINALFIILIIYSLATMSSGEMINSLMTLPGVIIAITFHEFAHAAMAVHYGDNTPREEGRYTLNPIKHLEWFGVIMLLFTHIGWGKPVRVNRNSFVNKSPAFCETMVALAGPLMNFLLAIIFKIAALLLIKFYYSNYILRNIATMLSIFVIINLGMGIFNLIPIYPLDGEKVFRNFLPAKWKMFIQNNYGTISFVFLFLWFVGILGVIVNPVIGAADTGLTYLLLKVINIF